ncbi:MAG: hypothetical protein H7343_06150 [Undibacterium sp.]|nr:hypothetical protein [Opitutaceae bacterium]
MKLPGALLLAALGLASSSSVHAADPAKVDYSERNTPYAPVPSVSPDKRAPELNTTLQNRRIAPAVLDRPIAAVGSRQAAIDITETKAKNLVTPDARRPEARTLEMNAFDHRESRFQPDAAHDGPKLAARYQSALTSARSTNVTSAPAVGAGTTARVNRFVFHRNTATPLGTTSAVTPAGGSTVARSFLRATP